MFYKNYGDTHFRYIFIICFIISPLFWGIKILTYKKEFPSLQSFIFPSTDTNKIQKNHSLYQGDTPPIPLIDKSNDFILDFDPNFVPIAESTDLEEDDLYERNNELTPIDKAFNTSKRFSTPGVSTSFGDVSLKVFGRSELKMGYGYATYLTNNDARDDFSLPNSNFIKRGFSLEPDININLKGKIGKRVLIDIDFDRTQKISENKIQVKYFALRKREFVQEVTIGNIDLDFPNSEFTNFKGFQQKNSKTIGVESKFRKGKFKFHAIGTLTRGEFATETFTGRNTNGNRVLADFEYTPRKYFQLEPFLYYDGLTTPPIISNSSYVRGDSQALNTFTSSQSTNFIPYNVKIDPSSIEVWLDDKNASNDSLLNARSKSIATERGEQTIGSFHRLQEGVDFKFNNDTGRLEFIRIFTPESCIYTRYTRLGSASNTSDPSARINIDGKIETFIYCGTSINEDPNKDGSQDIEIIPDGKINYDIYEVRGVYNLQAPNIQKTSFLINLIDKSLNQVGELNLLGQADIDYNLGVINFYLREPFKNVKKSDGSYYLDENTIRTIYAENQINPAEKSTLLLRSTFTQETQSYKLKNSHIIDKSVRIRVDGIEINPQLYIVDHYLGFFYFLSKDQPVITPATKIEVTYEYSPFGQNSNGFIVGLRSEYIASKDLTIGNTLLYNGQFETSAAPRLGEEPTSKFIIENDIKLDLNETRLTKLINAIPGVDVDLVPIRYKFYGEYTHSIYNPNTFGLALVDDMESAEESRFVSISEKDWVLSSVPPSLNTNICSRTPLYYRYYRDINNIELGPTTFSDTLQSSPDYQTLSGPYNISDGKLDSSQINPTQKQISLVLDFDFSLASTPNPFVSVVTRRFSNQSSGDNLSQIDYLEFSAKLINSSGLTNGVAVRFDIGSINEDADGDNQLDSEDIGLDGINNDINGDNIADNGGGFDGGEKNGILDYISNGQDEDVGYTFNSPSCNWSTKVGGGPNLANLPRTRGNGVLNTEDLNLDGFLAKAESENVVTLDELGNKPYMYFDNSFGLTPTNIIQEGQWNLVRIYLDASKLTERQLLALKSAKNIRMYLVPANGLGTQGKGKLLIDNIKLGSSKWRQKRIGINGLESDLTSPETLQTAIISTDDSRLEYKNNSFITTKSNEYDTLHGKKTSTERARIRESALKIKYNMNINTCGGACSYVYTKRVFTQPIDLRYYNKINIWLKKIAMSNPKDKFFIRLGSSDTDYIQLKTTLDDTNWKSIPFNLPAEKNIQNCSNNPDFKGCPNFKEINTMVLGIEKDSSSNESNGSFWVNDIYVSDPQLQSDNSYRLSNYLRIIKPLYKTDSGIPILDHIEVSYDRKYQGSRFFTLNQSNTNVSSTEDNIQVSTSILPWWRTSYKYLELNTQAEPNEQIRNIELQGTTKDYRHTTEHTFQFSNPYVPVTQIKYTYKDYTNKKNEKLNDQILVKDKNTETFEKTHTPYLSIKETTPLFLYQKIQCEFTTSSQFFIRDRNITESNKITPTPLFYNQESLEQTETFETKFIYQFANFSLQPSYSYNRVMLVKQNFLDNDNLKTIDGKFIFPLLENPSDYSYRQRRNLYSLKTLYQDLWFVTPEFNFIFQYQENSFKDNELVKNISSQKYNQYKQPNSLIRGEFNLVADPKNIWSQVNFIQSINFNFFREITVFESSLPFTKTLSVYDDEFGLKNRLGELSKRGFDIFSFPMWHHFLSKGRDDNNYANGRNYIQNINFKPNSPSNEYNAIFDKYVQNIALKENIRSGINWRFNNWLILITEGYIGQDARRNGNLGVNPTQRVTWGTTIKQTYDLMQVLNFGFWNKTKQSNFTRKSSTLDLNFTYENIGEITSNNIYHRYAPDLNISFNWFDLDNAPHTVGLKVGVGFIAQNKKDFFTENGPEEDKKIYNAIKDLPQSLKRNSLETRISILYSVGLYRFAQALQWLIKTNLRRYPKYTIEFIVDIKRFDYDIYSGLQLAPYDAYIINQILDINLHRNVTGLIYLKNVFDLKRNLETGQIRQRIFAIEFGIAVKIIF